MFEIVILESDGTEKNIRNIATYEQTIDLRTRLETAKPDAIVLHFRSDAFDRGSGSQRA